MRIQICLPVVAGIAALALSSTAMAADEAVGSAGVTATVPAVCDITADDFILTDSGSITGSVFEYCNTDTGFQITAAYRALNALEAVTVRYDGNATALNGNGSTVVAFRWGQRLAQVPVVIEARDLGSPVAVAFSLAAV